MEVQHLLITAETESWDGTSLDRSSRFKLQLETGNQVLESAVISFCVRWSTTAVTDTEEWNAPNYVQLLKHSQLLNT
jgi:hypothetical protein